ncbi:sarcosine oxidase subunit gamma [Leisingera thetidis]|uniref:sarcosine oxidase subunit gamma n=1 Tax=Leisingera thetidis TaxID=2930199 RepID=UPI0021F7CD0B|nr:sarcosine oxidase subunit gamma family protein [Leisingera thetidis]
MSAAEALPLFCLEGLDLTGVPSVQPAGVEVRIVTGTTVLRIMPFRDQAAAAGAALAPFGFTVLPAPGRFAEAEENCLAWAAGNCWHLISPRPALEQELKQALAGLAAVSSAGGGFLRLQISGTAACALMGKGCVLDLDRFEPGHCAVTLMAHTKLHLHRCSDTEFDLLIPASHAASFWEWLTLSAAEFGLAVQATAAAAQDDGSPVPAALSA